MTIEIQPAYPKDYPKLEAIWSRSVLATHDFLQRDDYEEIKANLIAHYFPAVNLYQAVDLDSQKIVGFLGVLEGNVEMLFIDADARGKGIGTQLLNFAIQNHQATRVDVNEQNHQAVVFYKHYGCTLIQRNPLDSAGKPYPILMLQLPS